MKKTIILYAKLWSLSRLKVTAPPKYPPAPAPQNCFQPSPRKARLNCVRPPSVTKLLKRNHDSPIVKDGPGTAQGVRVEVR